jgi:hypothetical protein
MQGPSLALPEHRLRALLSIVAIVIISGRAGTGHSQLFGNHDHGDIDRYACKRTSC